MNAAPEAKTCEGPLIWFSVGVPDEDAAILECARPGCGFLIVTGNWMDEAHASTPLLREGLA